MTHPNRRRFLGGALAAGATMLLSGCSTAVAGGLLGRSSSPSTLAYWNLFGGGDGKRMQAMVAAYQAATPQVTLEPITLKWGNPYYTKLSLATIGGKPPDVAVAHMTRVPTLQAAGLLAELAPGDMARHGMTADRFNATAWRAGQVGGSTFAVPLDTHPFVCFYNTDVCAKAGLLDGSGALRPITSEDALVDALRRAKQVTGQFGASVAAVSEQASPWRIFQTLYSQLGGQMIADSGRQVVIDDAKALRVLSLLSRLNVDGLMPGNLDYQGAVATFANGRAGFYFQGEWEITTFQTSKTPFGMTLFPNVYGGSRYAVQADSHALVLPRRDRSPAELDKALGFVRSMLDQSAVWAAGGHVPAWLPYRDSPDYAALQPQANYAAAADAAVYDPDAWYSGSGSNFEIVLGDAIGAVQGGLLTPEAGLARMRDQLTTLATTRPPL
ncbi:extracellular solute-binding protein [Pseudonocardia sp. CA-107938]|uniref:extracellular solute-binding protein n=1 Tax=Pseudonocardia sp. CA-107938 TaxID=3240021 RepID=UPI003D8F9DF8